MRARAGLTLLEALLAVAVLAVVIAALASLQLSNLRTTRAARLETQRLEAAVEHFETVKRTVETDFATWLECNDVLQACTFGPVTLGGTTVTTSVIGHPTLGTPNGPSLASRGLVAIRVEATNAGGTLTLQQYLSCLSVYDPTPPSVANPGVTCE